MWYPSWHQLKFPLAFVCASAIHGGLLWLPIPPQMLESEPIASGEVSVDRAAIATIPLADLTTPRPKPVPEPPTPAPDPKPTSAVAPAPQPPPIPKLTANTVQPETTPQPTPEREAKTVKPEPTPQPPPEEKAKIEAKTIEPEPTPDPTPEPIADPKTELVAGIAHLEGAKPGCHGSEDCHFLAGSTVRTVTQDLQARLEAEGFRLSESYRDTGLRVYEVSRDDKPVQFLHIASDNAGRDAFYLLSPQQKTLEELRSP